VKGNVQKLSDYWTASCKNHAAPLNLQDGLESLLTYHQSFSSMFSAFKNMSIKITDQIAESNKVVTVMETFMTQSSDFMGVKPHGREVMLRTIRIDFINEKISEHSSIADFSGFLEALKS
jgi:predicted ester cyclase